VIDILHEIRIALAKEELYDRSLDSTSTLYEEDEEKARKGNI